MQPMREGAILGYIKGAAATMVFSNATRHHELVYEIIHMRSLRYLRTE